MKLKSLFLFALAGLSVSASAQLRLDGQILVDPKTVNIGQLGGMILSGNLPSSTGTFLSINVSNDANEPKNVTLTAAFSYNGQELGKGRTKNRVRLAPRASVRLTNNNFMSGEWAMSGRTENNALVQDLMTRAGGKLPSGTYLLTWTLESDDGGFTSFPMSFTIAGNREAFVRLIAPGAHAGDRADEVNTKFPVF